MSDRNELDPRASDDDLLRAIRLLDPASPPAVEPPSDLWSRISAAAAGEAVADETVADGPGVVDDAVADGPESPPDEGADVAPVVDIASRRRRLPMLGAVAAAVIVVAVGFVVVLGSDTTSDEPVASVTLDPLVDDASSGAAELLAVGDGYTLRVDAEAVPAEGEFLELWLIDEGVTEPRSLGRFTGAGEYEVPAGIDPEAFPIVDISTEPDDGDASHSGASVLRGALEL